MAFIDDNLITNDSDAENVLYDIVRLLHKIEKLSRPCGLLISHKVLESKIDNQKVIFKVLITQCEADC